MGLIQATSHRKVHRGDHEAAAAAAAEPAVGAAGNGRGHCSSGAAGKARAKRFCRLCQRYQFKKE